MLKGFGVVDDEDTSHVFEPFLPVFVGLTVCRSYSSNVFVGYGTGKNFCKALAEKQALVVTSFSFFLPMEWNGNDYVDIRESWVFAHHPPYLSAHDNAEGLVAIVFKFMQQSLCLALLFEDKQCLGSDNGNSAYEPAFDDISAL